MVAETLVVAPNPAGPNEEIIVAGSGYKPGETVGVQLTHSKMQHSPRIRTAVVGVGGKFTCQSNSHVAGTIVIGVYRPPTKEAIEAAGKHPRRAARDLVAQIELTVEGGDEEDDQSGSIANPTDTSETDADENGDEGGE